MTRCPLKNIRPSTLRSYITLVITGIITIALILSSVFFYKRTSTILIENHRQQVMQELARVNQNITDQLNILDSVNSLFMSNTLIREAIDPYFDDSDNKLAVEKQMNFLLISTSTWQKNFIDTVCIFTSPTEYFSVSSGNKTVNIAANQNILSSVPSASSSLIMKATEMTPNALYFARSIFSSYTGKYIATIIIAVNKNAWISSYNSGINREWFIYLYNEELSVITDDNMGELAEDISSHLEIANDEKYLDEVPSHEDSYLVAAEKIPNSNLTSLVATPKSQILETLNYTLQTYLLVLFVIAILAGCVAFAVSRAVTKPISNMIYYTNRIAAGDKEKIPPMVMYSEFNDLAHAFNNMLDKLNAYYKDNLEKQLLLKNSEIQALQSQMDPHFLFNTLNTIAWKAQMTGSPEVYQMVISLGELLKSNVMSKDYTFISLADELRYVKFYTYLQKMRFEDKISVEIQADPSLYQYKIPCLCIQPLVENAFIHGLEPKKGNGKLVIRVLKYDTYLEILVADNGVGFTELPDMQDVIPSSDGTHTHVGLRNLDRRLFLLFGDTAHLNISSTINVCTTISFKIPLDKEA